MALGSSNRARTVLRQYLELTVLIWTLTLMCWGWLEQCMAKLLYDRQYVAKPNGLRTRTCHYALCLVLFPQPSLLARTSPIILQLSGYNLPSTISFFLFFATLSNVEISRSRPWNPQQGRISLLQNGNGWMKQLRQHFKRRFYHDFLTLAQVRVMTSAQGLKWRANFRN